MFDFFKRFAAPPKKTATASGPSSRRKPASRRSASALPGDPLPAPEVVEGNDHTDWDLWEDSVNALDSRMQGLTPSTKIYNSKAEPSQFDDLDVFSRVTKNRDL